MPRKEKTSKTGSNALSMLKEDHAKVKQLFDEFEEKSSSKADILDEILQELKVHAAVEEQLFYPVLRQTIKDEEGIMDEADEEHHVAKLLIAELDNMEGDEDNWEAKAIVLAENISYHIKEEEDKIFKEARKAPIDLGTLGEQMAQLKEKLQADGVPPDAEAKMIASAGLRGDSPAKKAQQKVEVPMKQRKAS